MCPIFIFIKSHRNKHRSTKSRLNDEIPVPLKAYKHKSARKLMDKPNLQIKIIISLTRIYRVKIEVNPSEVRKAAR